MEASLNMFDLLDLLALLTTARLQQVSRAGPCGESSADDEAMKLGPCAAAAQDDKAAVSDSCCLLFKKFGQSLSCLCAIMLSDTAKSYGVNPQVALTIPRRCNFVGRPVGYKCCPYTLP